MLNSCFGYQKASLDNVLGLMGNLTRERLAYKDVESLRVAQRRHVHETNIFDGTRLKKSTNELVFDWRTPRPRRMRLLDPDDPESAYVGGGQAALIEENDELDLDLDSDMDEEL